MYLQRKIYPNRILITADCIGGVWTYALDLCRKLSLKGIETALAVMGSSLSPDQKNEIKRIPNLFLFSSSYKLEWMDNPWEDVSEAGMWLKKIQQGFKADIIHLNSYSFGSLKWDAPVITVAHSDVYSWWNSVKNESPPENWNSYYDHVQAGLQNSDLVIAPSFYMLSALEKNFGTLTNRKVIYNGRDRSFFSAKEKQKYIFASGRVWDEAKNLTALVNAAAKIKYKVVIAGENINPANGKQLNFAGINFLRKISQQEMRKYLSGASIFVHPAKYEPFGLSPLEAAYSGAALVLSDIPSLREIWKDNAIYFNPDDEISLVEAVNQLISKDDLLQDYAHRAFVHSLNYSAEKMASEYMAVYSALIRNKNKLKKAEIY